MATDDIQPTHTAAGATPDSPVLQGNSMPVSADTLERWTRAVTTPKALTEQDADAHDAHDSLHVSDAPPTSTQQAPAQQEHPRSTERDAGGLSQSPAFNSSTGFSAQAPEPQFPGAPVLPRSTVQSPSAAATFRTDATVLASSALGSPALANAAATPLLAAASPHAAPSGPASFNSAQPYSFPPAPGLNPAPLLSTSKDGAHSIDARLADSPLPALQGAAPYKGQVNLGGNPATDFRELPEMPGLNPKQNLEQHAQLPNQHDTMGGKANAAFVPQQTPALQETDGARALSLSALRGMHAHHRDGRLDAGLGTPSFDSLETEHSSKHTATPTAMAGLLMPRIQTQVLADTGMVTDGVAAVGGNEKLHELIESCCSRLWVNDGGGRAPQGVMLDLGRWMPGCTVEVAKAAGVLRITLRGVDGAERARLQDELQGLGDGLAEKLGCQVVAAVATNKELT